MNSVTNPLISIIIPAYNAAPYLDGAIGSIRSQGYAPLELILVDDGSTDNTAQAAARHPDWAVLHQPNRGPAAARNRGLQAATGEYIAFLDADDLWAPTMLPRLLALLQERPAIGIVQGLIQRLVATPQADGSVAFQPEQDPYFFLNLGSGLFRRALFDRVGLFDVTLPDNEDTDWMIRAWECGVQKYVAPEVFLYYRVHAQSLTLGGRRNRVNFATLLQRRLVRLRNGQAPAGSRAQADLHHYLGAPPHNVPPLEESDSIIANDSWSIAGAPPLAEYRLASEFTGGAP